MLRTQAGPNGDLQSTSPLAFSIPQMFCWTKMGTEAGQSLETILRRKELERRSGDGAFSWGIGNSLGASADLARQLSPDGEVDVLFTPMKSAPKMIDSAPSKLLVWLAYYTNKGAMVDLPRHMLVTSRGGNEKRGHYALLCYSTEDIADQGDLGVFDATHARNLASLNPIGASQVTSVVKYDGNNLLDVAKPYKVAFRAKLHGAGFVRLASPAVMSPSMLLLYNDVCQTTSIKGWREGVAEIKEVARLANQKEIVQEDFFAGVL